MVEGFEAAAATDAGPTSSAAALLHAAFVPETAARMVRLLHAVWVASGGRSDLFPDGPQAHGGLSDDALAFVLAYRDVDDPDYWARVGADTTLEQLGRLSEAPPPQNLKRLVEACADSLSGRFCVVRDDEPRLTDEDSLSWGIEKGLLALRGATFVAYFATKAEDTASVPPTGMGGIDLDELRTRGKRSQSRFRDLTGSGETRHLSYGAEDAGDVSSDEALTDLLESVGGSIAAATAVMANGRPIECDFRSATASSRTKAVLTMRELARHGLPLVWPLADEEFAALAAAIEPAYAPPSSGQIELFDSPSSPAE